LNENGGAEFTEPEVGVPLSAAIEAIIFSLKTTLLYCHTVVAKKPVICKKISDI
jgi:hypothetical protein